MTEWKSTLDQPLRERDAEHILNAWAGLVKVMAEALTARTPEPVDMINHAADIRGAAWEVTRAVDEAWFQANKAITLSAPGPKAPSVIHNLLEEKAALEAQLKQLGLLP